MAVFGLDTLTPIDTASVIMDRTLFRDVSPLKAQIKAQYSDWLLETIYHPINLLT